MIKFQNICHPAKSTTKLNYIASHNSNKATKTQQIAVMQNTKSMNRNIMVVNITMQNI